MMGRIRAGVVPGERNGLTPPRFASISAHRRSQAHPSLPQRPQKSPSRSGVSKRSSCLSGHLQLRTGTETLKPTPEVYRDVDMTSACFQPCVKRCENGMPRCAGANPQHCSYWAAAARLPPASQSQPEPIGRLQLSKYTHWM